MTSLTESGSITHRCWPAFQHASDFAASGSATVRVCPGRSVTPLSAFSSLTGGAAPLAGFPGLEYRGQVTLRPVHREGAAVQQQEDGWLAHRHDALEQPLLRRGEIDARAVTALEAGHLDGHLLALEPRREAEYE